MAARFFTEYGRVVWSALLFLGGLFLLLQTTAIQYRAGPGELGPAFWPRLWLALLLALTAYDGWAALQGARASHAGRAVASGPETTAEDGPAGESWRLLLAGSLCVLLYVLGATFAGFMLATPVFLAAFVYLGGVRGLRPLLIALGSTAVLLSLFVRGVYVSLPIGQGVFADFTVAVYQFVGLY
jgi:hypothetical protein